MAKTNTGAQFEDLATAFRHGNFAPLYFFYGEEGFLIDELQALAVEHALQPHERDFNLDIVYGSEASTPDVLARCAALPMMAERRLVLVRAFDKLSDNRRFKSYAEQPNPMATVLLCCSGKPNLSAHPYRALKEQAVWAEFKPLYDRQMPGWVGQRLRSAGLTPKGGAAQVLADRVGTDLRTAANEVDKLKAYVGTAAAVTEEDVLAAAGQTREANVFELQGALGVGDGVRATAIAERLLGQASNRRSEAIALVAILTAYFGRLQKLHPLLSKGTPDRQVAGQIGVSPFFVKEYVRAARTYPTGRLVGVFESLLAADFELKGGSDRDERLVVTLLLRRLAGGVPRGV